MSVFKNVSVIIPLYNAEEYIGKALESCLQFVEVSEVIVVDDAYPDRAKNMVEEMATNEPRIKLFTHPGHTNKGAGASRNLGIEKASGDFIAFLDADDYYLPNRFEAEKKLFEDSKVDGVYGATGVHFYTETARAVFMKEFHTTAPEQFLTTLSGTVPPEDLFDELWHFKRNFNGYFHLDALTLRREALLKLPYFFLENLRLHQDTEFIRRLAYHCRLYSGSVAEPVAKRGMHEENRITSVKSEQKKARNRYLQHQEVVKWAKHNALPQKKISYFKKQEYQWLKKTYNPKLQNNFFLKTYLKLKLLFKNL